MHEGNSCVRGIHVIKVGHWAPLSAFFRHLFSRHNAIVCFLVVTKYQRKHLCEMLRTHRSCGGQQCKYSMYTFYGNHCCREGSKLHIIPVMDV
jgi:hypothetical protein